MNAQEFDSALIYFDKAIEIDTTYYVAYGNKSSLYCSLKDFKNAFIEIQKEIAVKPDLAEGWTFAGMLSDKLGDTLNAMTYYKKSLALFDERIINPSKQEFLDANKRNRALCLILMGQDQEGRNELKRLKEAHPDDKSLDDLIKLSKHDYLNQIFDDQ
jgi:tetratricopeptide (TPR) repeat protein